MRPLRVCTTALTLGLAVYYAWFIFQTSFLIWGQRYFCLFDDAMVSMRYARNLALGNGLVWNVGERVEGISNLGWTLLLSLISLLPLGDSLTCLAVQVISACILSGTVYCAFGLARQMAGGNSFAGLVGAFLVGTYFPLVNWTLQGMEVGLLSFLLTACIWQACRELKGASFSRWLYVGLAVAVLVRMDAVLPAAVICGFLAWQGPKDRKRHLIWGIGTAIVCLGGQTLFRYAYYGDILPNTYYLKLTGFPTVNRMARGAWCTARFLVMTFALLGVVEVAFRLVLGGTTLRLRNLMPESSRPAGLVLLVFGGQIAYNIYIGADAWEALDGCNRFVTIAMPSLIALVAARGWKLCEGTIADRARFPVALLLLAVAWTNLNFHKDPRHPDTYVVFRRPFFVAENRRNVELALAVKSATQPGAKVAVDWAGAIPYFMDRPAIDLLGKSDHHVARLPMHRGVMGDGAWWKEFYPGHLKWDYGYSIGQRQPDVVLATWGKSVGDSAAFLGPYDRTEFEGFSVYGRIGSSRVDFSKLRQLLGAGQSESP
ncbi:MAG: hypothetical protein K1X53_10185 [Candidatus Sumerlaeaceae bacterium]|nr:hypothetical protein [Candidatus Sumerlaeaceae bacterium]